MAKKASKTEAPAKPDRTAGKTASGTLERRAAVAWLIDDDEDTLYVTGLAGAKGDVLAVTGGFSPRVYPLGGAMGAAAGMALGLALAQPGKRVVCVTGEGELLMNVGTLATIGILNPPNLRIVCVDNEHYGETGFQRSHTGLGVDLAKIAEASGIPAVRTITKERELADGAALLRQTNGTAFVLVKVKPSDPPVPKHSRDASLLRSRFREALLGSF